MAEARELCVRYVQSRAALLLDLRVRVYDLFGLHGGKLLGDDLQRHYLDMSRLRRHTEFWKRLTHANRKRIGK
jgi:hypothetical protein